MKVCFQFRRTNSLLGCRQLLSFLFVFVSHFHSTNGLLPFPWRNVRTYSQRLKGKPRLVVDFWPDASRFVTSDPER
jgi:hypothetical protein